MLTKHLSGTNDGRRPIQRHHSHSASPRQNTLARPLRRTPLDALLHADRPLTLLDHPRPSSRPRRAITPTTQTPIPGPLHRTIHPSRQPRHSQPQHSQAGTPVTARFGSRPPRPMVSPTPLVDPYRSPAIRPRRGGGWGRPSARVRARARENPDSIPPYRRDGRTSSKSAGGRNACGLLLAGRRPARLSRFVRP